MFVAKMTVELCSSTATEEFAWATHVHGHTYWQATSTLLRHQKFSDVLVLPESKNSINSDAISMPILA
jgi:hypothetical protein